MIADEQARHAMEDNSFGPRESCGSIRSTSTPGYLYASSPTSKTLPWC